jgi:hypothetical protein
MKFELFKQVVNTVEAMVGEGGRITEANMFTYDYAVVKGETSNGEKITLTLDFTKGEKE